jgi:cytochrome c5
MRALTVCAIVPVLLGIASLQQEMQSTMTGVYTAPQAKRGEETYMAVCVACHPAGTYKAAGFKATWTGRPLSDLYEQVKEKMPKNDPASLTPDECAQVLAYLLKINDVPAGETELPPDVAVLKKIRIEMPAQNDRH